MGKSIRIRYLSSFILVVMIPVIILGIFTYIFNINNNNNYIINAKQAAFQQAVSQINYLVGDIDNLAAQLSSNEDKLANIDGFGSVSVNESKVFSELSSLEVKARIKMKVLLYFRGDNDIYSSSDKIFYSTFEKSLANDADLVMSKFYTKLNTIMTPLITRLNYNILDKSKQGGMVSYIIPLTYNSSVPKADIIFLIEEDALLREFTNIMGDYNSTLYVYNSQMELVFGNDAYRQDRNVIKLSDVFRIKGVGVLQQKVDGTDVILMRTVSEEKGLTYIVASEKDKFFSELLSSQRILTILIVFLLIFSIIFALFMTYYNYKPIKSLIRDIVGANESCIGETNEFDVIKAAYRKSMEQNKSLSVQVDNQHNIITTQFILKLINEKWKSREEFNYYAKCANLDFNKEYNVVMLLSLYNIANKQQYIDMLLGISSNFAPEGTMVLCTELVWEKGICYIFNFSSEPEGSELKCAQLAEQLNEFINTYASSNTFIGVGNVYRDPLMLNRSFYEAAASLQSATDDETRQIYYYHKNAENSRSNCGLPLIDQSLLIEGVRHGDLGVAISAFEEILRYINRSVHSFLLVRLLCFDILNVVIKLAAQQNINLDLRKFENISFFNTISDYHDEAVTIITYVCTEIRKRREQDNTNIKNSVIEFIRNNFTSSNFSLEFVSESLNLTKSKINSILKEDAGNSFSQYVSILRMNEVKRNLIESDKNVQDIVKNVGYIDVSTFVRKFKELEGITPGQYRILKSR